MIVSGFCIKGKHLSPVIIVWAFCIKERASDEIPVMTVSGLIVKGKHVIPRDVIASGAA